MNNKITRLVITDEISHSRISILFEKEKKIFYYNIFLEEEAE